MSNSLQGKKVCIYCRAASGDIKQIDGQEAKLRAYVRSNGGYIIRAYKDCGLSGKAMNRPQLNKLLQDAEHDRFDVIVVTSMDRLSRDTELCLTIECHLKNKGIELVTLDSTPISKLMRGIVNTIIEFDRIAKVERKGIFIGRQQLEQSNVSSEKKFHAFGKLFTRDEAERLIYMDRRCEIVHASNSDSLEEIIYEGWKPLREWSDTDIQDRLDNLIESNVTG